jgi:hypothetical protein
MPKKQTSTQRTEVKALPKKSKKLTSGDMKKVEGGASDYFLEIEGIKGESSERGTRRK